jgi:hypothetical protein
MRNALMTTLALAASTVLASCGADSGATAPPPPPPPVLLKDVVIPHLPSPYYHFAYDAMGRVAAASFASDLRAYDVTYTGDRIREMRNNVVANGDRLVYVYDDAGRVGAIRYVDSNGVTFTLLIFSYDGPRLTGLERDRRVEGGFIIDKTMSFSYYPDGNLLELTEHRPAIDGRQDETTTVDRFERYDDKINVDGFSLIHDDFFDHLVLLPGVQLQKGNPGRLTHTGNDQVNHQVDYTYTYDDRNRPLAKSGDLVFLNGPNAGQRFQTRSEFSYY